MKTPIIRFVKKEDLESLIELCRLHAIFEKATYHPKGKYQKLEKNLFSESPSLHCLIVEHLNDIVGYATYMRQFSTWNADFYLYMDCLFLNEEFRGFGIGKQLINKIKEEAKKTQCTHIEWQTPVFNKRAIEFYDRIGAVSKSKERYSLSLEQL